VAGRKVLPGLANGLGCLHISAQIAAVQTSDVGLSFMMSRRNAAASNCLSCFSSQVIWLIILSRTSHKARIS
jgi:hypothetical protein